jgi:mono/diheme cytochrome c family protein
MNRWPFCLAASALLIGASCESLSNDYLAPCVPVEDAQLYQGRRLYLTKCVRCHAPEPVLKYSRAQWDEILPEMIADTRLSAADAEAVTRYVRHFRP